VVKIDKKYEDDSGPDRSDTPQPQVLTCGEEFSE